MFAAGSSELDVALADQILDWSAAYRTGVSVSGGYGEIAPAPPPMGPYGYSYAPAEEPSHASPPGDFAAALNSANAAFGFDAGLRIVAVQAGSDVAVFVETNGDLVADLGVLLAGASLNDIDATNFVSPGGAAPPATAGLHLNLSASAWN